MSRAGPSARSSARRGAWHTVRAESRPLVPWRNGAGVGRDLLLWPSAEYTLVRIGLAEIERDGPFSPYPGITRHFAVVAGTGVRLRLAAGEAELRGQEDVCVFDGAEAPSCKLIEGPARALNLMVRASAGSGRLVRADPGAEVPTARLRAFYEGGVLHWSDRPEAPPPPVPAGAWLMTFDPRP